MTMVDTVVHPSNKPVNLILPVTSISTFYKMGGLFHSTSQRRWFEGPQEVVWFFEAFSNSIDLLNQILHADDPIFTKGSSNQCVICQDNSFFVDFPITTLVDQFIYWLQVRVPHAIYGSTIHSMFIEALLSLTKVPLKIWQRWRSCSTFQTFGLTPLMPLILMTNASLGSAGI